MSRRARARAAAVDAKRVCTFTDPVDDTDEDDFENDEIGDTEGGSPDIECRAHAQRLEYRG